MGKSYKKNTSNKNSKAYKQATRNKNRQINREFNQRAYNTSEAEKIADDRMDDFIDYAEDFSFEKFSRTNGKR